MYQGNPTTETGSFNMTTITLRSAFGGKGNAHNGYRSKTFDRFCKALPVIQQRVEQRYQGIQYPQGTDQTGTFDPANGTVSMGGKASTGIYPRAFKLHGDYAYSVFFDRSKAQGVLSRMKINE